MSLTPARRKKTLGLALAAGLASSLLAVAGVAAPVPAAGDDTTTDSLRVGSYNIEINQPMDQFTAAVDFIKSVSDVAGLQEAGGAQRRQYLDGDHSWRIYHAPDLPQVPVIWNPRVYELVSAHQVKISDAATVEKAGRGLMQWKAAYVPVVRLRQISTGYVFSLINVHLIRGAVNKGLPRKDAPRTYRVYRHQVKVVKRTVREERERGLPVYVTGDFNVGYVADRQERVRKLPYRRLTSVHQVANWKGKSLNDYGTHIDTDCPKGKAHCGAYIDQIWGPTVAATSTVFTSVVHSDHYPIMSSYPIPVASGFRAVSGTIGFSNDVTEREWNKPYQTKNDPMVFGLNGDMSHGFADVRVTNGTGVEGVDFTVDTSSLYDNDPDNNRVVVTTIPNFKREPDKTFTLTLVNPFNTTITDATATGTITNDD
jgi:hypothetical protein